MSVKYGYIGTRKVGRRNPHLVRVRHTYFDETAYSYTLSDKNYTLNTYTGSATDVNVLDIQDKYYLVGIKRNDQ